MSHTLRFYNRPVRGTWKRFRDALGLFHPFAQRCMGRCRNCRNGKQDQRILRKARVEDFRREVTAEMVE